MPVLIPGRPVASAAPTLLVENRLAPGTHRFALVVVDAAGNESAAASVEVQVARLPSPTLPVGGLVGRVTPRPLPRPLRPGGPR